jgi:hypothetical protein
MKCTHPVGSLMKCAALAAAYPAVQESADVSHTATECVHQFNKQSGYRETRMQERISFRRHKCTMIVDSTRDVSLKERYTALCTCNLRVIGYNCRYTLRFGS